MRLNHNLASLNIYRVHTRNVKEQSAALERISSGYKLQRAGQNPNAIAQSERLRMQIRGLQVASRNTQDGISMLQAAEGGIDGITNNLQRIRELLLQGGGTTTANDKQTLQEEVNQMLHSIDDIAKNTEFNGIQLLHDVTSDNANPNAIDMVNGAGVGEKNPIPKYNLSTTGLQLKDASGTVQIQVSNLEDALTKIDHALNTTLSVASKYGALESKFESTYLNLNEITTKIEGAESSIRDADIAEEMLSFAKTNVLLEAGNAMMVQTNKFPQDVLRILENVRNR